MPLQNDDGDDIKRQFKYEMMMTMMPDVIEKKWQHHDDLDVSINDASPCSGDLYSCLLQSTLYSLYNQSL